MESDDFERSLRGGGLWSKLSPPATVGVVALLVPLVAHFTINGLDYVQLAAGGLAAVAGLAAIPWAFVSKTRSSKAVDAVFGLAVLGLGVSLTLWSGGLSVASLPFFDRTDDARQRLAEEGFEQIEITRTSDDGQGFEFAARLDGDWCTGSIRIEGGALGGGSSESLFRACSSLEPLDRVQARCDAGDRDACGEVPPRLRGEEPVDWTRANAAALRACTLGVSHECYELGLAYGLGERGVPVDRPQALQLYTTACEGGERLGCFNRGAVLTSGEGVDRDQAAAAAAYGQSCDLGFAEGCARLALAHHFGDGVPQDDARARELNRRACDGDASQGCVNLAAAWLDGDGGDRSAEDAYRLYRRGCELDRDEIGCRMAALMLRDGEGVEANPAAALGEIRALCESGESAGACTELGISLHGGDHGLARDRAEALRLFERGCEGGSSAGCRNVAVYAEDGLTDGGRDLARARTFFARSCELGNQRACRDVERLR